MLLPGRERRSHRGISGKDTREALRARLGDLKPMVIALEVGTHSRWVSELLQEFGARSDSGERARVEAITEATARATESTRRN